MTTQDSAVPSLKRTPLYEQHRALGARLVEFGGWDMPVQYSGIIEEHRAVRTKAGLFDVSHMGEFKVEGSDALAFLQYLVPNDVSRLAVGQALYTQLCRPDGTTIDDLLIYHLAEEQYMLVVNAANIDKDYAWIESHAQKFANVTLSNQSDTTALIALQGPLAMSILQPLADVKLDEIKYYHFAPGQVAGIRCLISRTGYTGEDGFELYCPSVDAARLWQTLLEAGKPQGVLPAGLGARDTLRLEAAYCLYGHELDDETNPLEAGLGWTVKLKKSAEFIGQSALQQAKEQGLKKRLVGIELLERGVPRGGYAIYDGEQRIGVLTSGSHGPTVQKSIGLGFVDLEHTKVGTHVQIEIRGKRVAAQVVALPFYKRGE
ncbi:aminomethyltransferase [Ktedonobacter sp. SOSP1-52]|uniref:glycine cleavage system aminomethyltransferase GcvT n=1 Tax=Ktedonobacter sp. SOSP1-52 TaxID=2778366 RepID=UPI001916830B|nr:glycine cleavage system aminomethyltransferase GcvT [Ktedonobacter sp. SOSP1-52]GHO69408.1 aminomethyltransferase [Ktedonobacter sp. SOSP1-52]